MEKNLSITKLSHLKKLIASLEKNGSPEVDMDISFEYIVGSCFPLVYQNVLNKLKDEYTKGYIQGLVEGKDLTVEEIYDKIKVKKND